MKDRKVTGAIALAMNKIALFMEAEVKQSIAGHRAELRSFDTGLFARSVKNSATPVTATVSSNVEYAKFLEYGTTKFTARSHFRNSLKRNKPKITSTLQKGVNTAVKFL